ncbi:hypothetical protein [Mycobacterium asiaticum]|uniref:hypothetical protein n=1 Tax=Mycobacterium asiaticum TaxID=1790 RepID=UPI0009C0249B|nr:hypothetical protein [Mycobacterium asiaticum]
MTDISPATPPDPTWTRWLYLTLAVSGIAVSVFVIGAGAYLLFAHPSPGHSAQPDCCKSMEADMKKMMADPKMPMNNPQMPTMPPMPSMSPMPGTSPMPSMPNRTP